MPVVAVSREIGAGVAEIAERVATELRAEVVDRRIIDELARRLQIPQQEAEALDETTPNLLERLLGAVARSAPAYGPDAGWSDWTPPHPDDPAFDARHASRGITDEVIRAAARTGNVVIVGRGAAFLLKDDRSVLRVFLRAPLAARTAGVMRSLGLDARAAERRVKESDINWGAYVRDAYHVDWRDPSNYDLILDTSRLGGEAAARVILAALPGLR